MLYPLVRISKSLIRTEYDFPIVVPYLEEISKFPLHDARRAQEIADLDICFFSKFFSDKVDFGSGALSDIDRVSLLFQF